MNKTERIQAAVFGDQPDHLPYSFWTHLPGFDLDPVRLAEKTYQFYKDHDIDFIKTMNNGMYAVEDYGCAIDASDIEHGGVAKLTGTPILSAADWGKLASCRLDQGSLKRELLSLSLLLEKVKDENVPVLFTVFSPMTTAEKLSGGKLLSHIAGGHGKDVHKAESCRRGNSPGG